MLELKDIEAGYDGRPVLKGISLDVKKGEIVALLGPNGAGKSTVIKTITGILRPQKGNVLYNKSRINDYSLVENIRNGFAYLPQGSRVFTDLTVIENLYMGGYMLRDKNVMKERIGDVFTLFPELKKRGKMDAGDLSGGEKQMLSLGRALMLNPAVLFLDEPSLGLSPKSVRRCFETIKTINQKFDISILIVEQKVKEVLEIADRVYIMRLGRIVVEDTPANLTMERIKEAFLGG
jgi:branched-chain amino acid transport system ATP-binding protein